MDLQQNLFVPRPLMGLSEPTFHCAALSTWGEFPVTQTGINAWELCGGRCHKIWVGAGTPE